VFTIVYALPIPLLIAFGLTILAMRRSAIANLWLELTTNASVARNFFRDHSCGTWRGLSGCCAVSERFYRGFGVTVGVICLAVAVILVFLIGWLRAADFQIGCPNKPVVYHHKMDIHNCRLERLQTQIVTPAARAENGCCTRDV
jgi:hypothetical protein